MRVLRAAAGLLCVLPSVRATPHHDPQQQSPPTGQLRGSGGGRAVKPTNGRPAKFTDVRWTSEKGQLRLNGQTFHLKGIAWFGMEDDGATLHGLDQVPIAQVLDFLVNKGFNTVRLTLSLEFAMKMHEEIPNYDHLRKLKDQDFWQLNRGQLLSTVVDKLAERNLLVLLDMHRLSFFDQGELWYGNGYTEEDLKKGWDNVLTLLHDKWNIMGLDLKNEPRGVATWGTGDLKTDWALAAARISQFINDKHPGFHGLFFVQGVENPTGTSQTSTGRWWGGDLEGVRRDQVDLGSEKLNQRVVYAPHIYGPEQYMMDYFVVSDFPENLGEVFTQQWGFARELTQRAVVIGEWGGDIAGANDKVDRWAQYLVDYLTQHCITDSFFWALNPESADTGGLLGSDWKMVSQPRMQLLDRLQPTPSKLTYNNATGDYSFVQGAPANPKCRE